MLQEIAEIFRETAGFDDLDRCPDTMRPAPRGKCTLECSFRGVELDLSFDEQGGYSLQRDVVLGEALRTALDSLSPNDRLTIMIFNLIFKFWGFTQAPLTRRNGKMKNVGAVILGLEALRNTRGQNGATEVSTAIDMFVVP